MNTVDKTRKTLTVNKDETISIDEIIKRKGFVDNLTIKIWNK